MYLTLQHRAFLVEQYFRNGGMYNETLREKFHESFPGSSIPHRTTVYAIVKRFQTLFTLEDVRRSGRPSIVNEQKVNGSFQLISREPSLSLRRLSQQSGLSRSSMHRVLRKRLNLYPYKVSVRHELLPRDYVPRVAFCVWFKSLISINGDNILDNVIFSDEAWFHLKGHNNSQNNRIWADRNPNIIIEAPLYPQKIGVWSAFSRKKIYCTVFFTSTVTGEIYIQDFISPLVNSLDDKELTNVYFQQDGAKAHTSANTMSYLKNIFGDRLISTNLWPARSPDLTPLDYYLWGMLKNKVYVNNPQTISELKFTILNEIALINGNELKNVFENLKTRLDLCIEEDGGHFQQLIK